MLNSCRQEQVDLVEDRYVTIPYPCFIDPQLPRNTVPHVLELRTLKENVPLDGPEIHVGGRPAPCHGPGHCVLHAVCQVVHGRPIIIVETFPGHPSMHFVVGRVGSEKQGVAVT